MWAAGVALVAVLALTSYVAFSGGDGGGAETPAKGGGGPSASAAPSPSATYAPPDDWTEPSQWAALPRGARTDQRGSTVGFPKSTEGAVAMMVAANTTAIEGTKSNADEQLRIYHSYIGKADQSAEAAETIELNALASDKSFAKQMSVEPGQPLPPGAYVRSAVVGYKVIKKSDAEVSVWLLSRAVQKAGETKKESGSYTRTLAGAQWEGGDWKLTSAATERAQQAAQGQPQPKIAAPGDPDFNTAGWTAMREAS
jgi:acyl dehydratase